MNIRIAEPADIVAMIRLERQCAGVGHWGEAQYRQLMDGAEKGIERLVLVMEETTTLNSADFGHDGTVERVPLSGFLVARQVPPEWELENIAVDPSRRRTGLGTQLLDALLVHAKRASSESVWLEVRESNHAARAFYEKAGFHESGRRKTYYANPAEDAVLYRLEMRALHLDAPK
jgi:[ribosomal protein S18]-alanine N-acetyltransferase